jgi:hypothetical protein
MEILIELNNGTYFEIYSEEYDFIQSIYYSSKYIKFYFNEMVNEHNNNTYGTNNEGYTRLEVNLKINYYEESNFYYIKNILGLVERYTQY